MRRPVAIDSPYDARCARGSAVGIRSGTATLGFRPTPHTWPKGGSSYGPVCYPAHSHEHASARSPVGVGVEQGGLAARLQRLDPRTGHEAFGSRVRPGLPRCGQAR